MTKMKQETLKELVESNDNRERILVARSRGGKRGINICDMWITEPELMNALECVAIDYYEKKSQRLEAELLVQKSTEEQTAPKKAVSKAA